MSDFSSELPIRSQLPGQVAPDDVIIKIGDATNPTTQIAKVDTHGSLYSVLADSSGNLIGDQHLSSTWWLQTVSPATGPAAPGTAATFSNLVGGIYNSPLETLTPGQQSALQLDSVGRLLVELGNLTGAADFNWGVVGAQTLRVASEIGNATGAANFNYGSVNAQTLQVAAQLGNAAGAIDYNSGAPTAQTIRVAADLFDATGTPFSATNPLPVTVDTVSGTAVDDFVDAPSIASGASNNHDYTVPAGKTLFFDQVIATSAGLMKMIVAVETGVATGIFTTKFVQFNSTANPNINFSLLDAIQVATGVRVRVTLTNLDKGATDLYSTICGHII